MSKLHIALLFGLGSIAHASYGEAFDSCPSTAFLMQGTPTTVYGVNLTTGSSQTLQTDVGMTGNLNAVGFNETDNYIYAFNTTNKKVVKVDKNFNAQELAVTGIGTQSFYVGDVSNNTLYLYRYGAGLYKVPLDSADPNYLALTAVGGTTNMRIYDFAFHPSDGNIYAVDGKFGTLYQINPATGVRTSLGNTGVKGTFGAAYFESDGMFYLSRNQDGHIFKIDITDPNNIIPIATLFAVGPLSGQNDGVRCASAAAQLDALDLGDAPNTYKTTIASNGPRHDLTNTDYYLGAVPGDAETAPAASDDGDGFDDEDGIIFTSLEKGQTSLIAITASTSGYLNGWIDWNKDGDFADNGEKVFSGTSLSAGMTTAYISVPDYISEGDTWARFRFSSTQNLDYYGGASDGEVEDYPVTLENSNLSTYNYGPYTAAFEDSWPKTGDYDLNDVVVEYNIVVKAAVNYDVKQVQISGSLKAMGADYRNGFAIHLPELARESVDESNIVFVKNGELQTASPLEAGQTNAVLMISPDLYLDIGSDCPYYRTKEDCQEVDLFNFSVTVPLVAGTKLWALPPAPYDPFIFAAEGQYHGDGAVTGRALEIHLDDYEPTDLGSASLTLMGTVNDGSDLASGSAYRASSGLPWGLLISDTWVHPRERTDVLNAYPKFFDYATKGTHNDWFTPGKRVNSFLFAVE
ncbi:TPA: LruC domain-containing protein [Photobacterium damselae]|uniref:LruC domain-containing protein n=2 Tax=Gammaproteobacteria TaxID=1236 RepID=A0A850QK70_PHODD|nr:LruC domain-containing protein [Photobacterium damselae]MBA5683665.1 LruC domain-containing protein [Photobacterium damselae subsp. damselae]MCG9704219.1 LruC domain-containing protein [Photobacterium damselae]MDC4167205.1 LruC domain-containing protein [Photobacterium damselae]NVO99986.1 LruC domain-containing protein [Photobacterium damselae subsp. damselae]PSB84884.1 hypothetical protein C5F64_12710 [Photobacterium damselae subsp. damselae]